MNRLITEQVAPIFFCVQANWTECLRRNPEFQTTLTGGPNPAEPAVPTQYSCSSYTMLTPEPEHHLLTLASQVLGRIIQLPILIPRIIDMTCF